MNFQQLKFAVAVADTGSFTKAAEICCITQPALSNAINQLEEELGAQLFERTTRSVSLTDFGKRLITDMREIGSRRETLYRHASEFLAVSEKSVRIGVSPLVSADYIEAMLSRIKSTDDTVEVILTEMNKSDIKTGLEGGVLDFGLLPAPMSGDTLECVPIYAEPLLFLSSEPNGDTVTPICIDALTDQQMLMVNEGCGLAGSIRTLCMENQVSLTEYQGRALSYPVLETWTQLGIGVSLLPASKVKDLRYARSLHDRGGDLVSLEFQACWNAAQEARQTFNTVMAGIKPLSQADSK